MGQPVIFEDDYRVSAQWTLTTADGTGAPYLPRISGQATVQFGGNFGAGGTVALEVSNDGATWTSPSDLAGAAISGKTGAGLFGVRESPLYYRARLTSGGDGTTSILATLVVRALRPK